MPRITIPCIAAVALCAAVLTPFPATAQAADGAYEINQDCAAVGCFPGDAPGYPVTILSPGNYVLTSNLFVSTVLPGGGAGIRIQSTRNRVALNLNGHTIDGGGRCETFPATNDGCTGFAVGSCISVVSPDQSDNQTLSIAARIFGGTIRGCFAGMEASGATNVEAEEIVVSDSANGIVSNGSFVLRRSKVNGNYAFGVTGTTAQLWIEDSEFLGNGRSAINCGSDSTFVHNRFSYNRGFAIECTGPAALQSNVFVRNNASLLGIEFQVGTLRDMGGNVCIDTATCP